MNKTSFYILIIIFLFACKGTKNLPEGQFLYTGAEIKIETPKKISKKPELMSDLQGFLKPEPNDAILGMRPKLWLYNIYDTVKKEKGFKHWVKYKLGNEPVLLTDVNENRVATSIQTSLENHGFFNATVNPDVQKEKKTASMIYNATVSTPYTFGEIHLPEGNSPLAKALRVEEDQMVIASGQRYDLQKLEEQRTNFQNRLKNEGFYFFSKNYIEFEIDSTVGDKNVEIFTTIKKKTPPKAKQTQVIDEIIVSTDYEVGDTTANQTQDSLEVMNYTFVRNTRQFRPEVIARQIRIDEGNLYTKVAEDITVSRLLDLGVFKYVNVFYESTGEGHLRSHVRLSPMKKKAIRVKLQAVTNSNGFAGPATELSFTNRNIFGGAERYELKLTGAYEWQIANTNTEASNLNSYEFGIQNQLRIPRFITPFNFDQYSTRFVPFTHFRLGFNVRKRINYFQLNTFELGYGFNWKETKTKTHNLDPVDVSLIRLSSVSDEFQEILDANRFLRQSYESQFLLGASYDYIFNSKADPNNQKDRHNFYWNGGLDISGNVMHAIQNTIREEENTDEDPYTIFGQPYSQYLRVVSDLRHYLRFNNNNKLASRLIIGSGFPYGNSSVLPYTMQFSIGGSSSIRAFRPRSLGPGTYNDNTATFFDQTADIKIEANVEYRFHLVGSFKGAVFLDAGNIWTIREDSVRQGGQFKFQNALSEMALGAGVGVRLDVDFFVLRVDLATPVRVPYREPGERWFLAVGNKEETERYDNLSPIVLNIAIGYPF